MKKGQQVSRGHYSATCSYCNFSWKHGKPQILREHLANYCKKYSQDVSLYYANIVGKKIGESTNVENISSDSESELPNKKKQKLNEQTSISSFYKNNKQGWHLAIWPGLPIGRLAKFGRPKWPKNLWLRPNANPF